MPGRLRRLELLREEKRPSPSGEFRPFLSRIPNFVWLHQEVQMVYVRQCGKCRSWVPKGKSVCGHCGHVVGKSRLSKAWRLSHVDKVALAGIQHLLAADDEVENSKYRFGPDVGRRRGGKH